MQKANEIINIHIGGIGIQIGEQIWKQQCIENNILPTGELSFLGSYPETSLQYSPISKKYSFQTSNFHKLSPEQDNNSLDTKNEIFFEQLPSKSNFYKARALFVDIDGQDLQQKLMINSPYRSIFNKERFLSSKRLIGSDNLFSVGKYLTKDLIEETVEQLRKTSESADNLQGFEIHHGIAGGTGSGLTSALLPKISQQYPKKVISTQTFFSSLSNKYNLLSGPQVGAYNSVLGFPSLIEFANLSYYYTLNGIADVALSIANEQDYNIFELVDQFSGVINALHWGRIKQSSLKEIQTTMVPYPRIHFINTAYQQLMPNYLQSQTSELSYKIFQNQSFLGITENNYSSQCKQIASELFYRGNQFNYDGINPILKEMEEKNRYIFMD